MPPRDSKTIAQIASLDTKVGLIGADVSELKGEMKSVNKILAVQEENLRQHMESVRLAREQNELIKQELEGKIAPIQKHVNNVNFLGKIMIALVAFPAAMYYIAQLVRMLMGKI